MISERLGNWNGLRLNHFKGYHLMTSEEKTILIRKIPSMLKSNKIEELDEFHQRGQKSIRVHFCSHLCYARFHATQGQWFESVADLWRMSMSPMATVSRRLGLNQNRRFFGLGPYR